MNTLNTIKTIVSIKNIKGASYIGIRGYENKQGEISDYTLLANVSYENMLINDLRKLVELDLTNLFAKYELELVQKPYNELLDSYTKRLSDEQTKANLLAQGDETIVRSQAQIDAYINLGNGIRVNKETNELHVYGLIARKKVIKSIEYKEVKSRLNTIIKNEISKLANLRSDKFRNFIVGNIDEIKVNGMIIK
jgi:hypothetical protein